MNNFYLNSLYTILSNLSIVPQEYIENFFPITRINIDIKMKDVPQYIMFS